MRRAATSERFRHLSNFGCCLNTPLDDGHTRVFSAFQHIGSWPAYSVRHHEGYRTFAPEECPGGFGVAGTAPDRVVGRDKKTRGHGSLGLIPEQRLRRW